MPYFINPYVFTTGTATGPGASWPYYVEITIPAASIGSTLTSFPVYVNLANLPAGFFTNVKSDGGDIRVYDATGSTEMPRQVLSINTGTSSGELWFKASTLDSSSDTTYRVYYGNASASNYAVGATYGRNAVWSDYVMVLHNADTNDATGNHTPTATGTSPTTNGKMGNATVYNGSSDHLTVTDHADFDFGSATDVTVSFWLKTNLIGNADIFVKPNALTAPVTRVHISSNGGTYAIRAGMNDGSTGAFAHATEAINTNTWKLVHAVLDRDADATVYYDGVSKATASLASIGNVDTGSDLLLGYWGSGSGAYFNGTLDEMRVRRSTLSSAWAAAEYLNQNTPATFYSVGTQTANS